MNRRQRIWKRARATERRGILLLVVLSLLVLFLLVGTSFIVSSNQYRLAQKALAAASSPETMLNSQQQQGLLDEVMNQVVRDTSNPHSSLRYHSLLRDIYGEDGIYAELPSDTTLSFAPNTGKQLIRVRIVTSASSLRQLDGYYNGLLWTTTTGKYPGNSMRIVNYRFFSPDTYVFDLLRPEPYPELNPADPNNPIELAPPGARVVINGRPFNGTGVGFNPQADPNGPQLNATERMLFLNSTADPNSLEIALMPNAIFFDPNNLSTFGYGSEWPGRGGSDESYDAVDFQNMALAMMPVSPIETLLRSSNPGDWPPAPNELGNIVLPSFHRPDLIYYWENRLGQPPYNTELDEEPSLLRKVMLRPSWFDHPKFTGSNPEFAALVAPGDPTVNTHEKLMRMIYGPWDVDNDNDGRRDSVWVDFGAPVMMGPNGKLVKPLVAVLCVDLDNRLNINAHGTLMMADLEDEPEDSFGNDIELQLAGNTGVESDDLPRGSGYGPAEISLEPVLGGAMFERLVEGITAGDQVSTDQGGNPIYAVRSWAGRYGLEIAGDDALPGSGYESSQIYDLQMQMKQQGMPQWANTSATIAQKLGNYATPPDLKGRYGVGLNALGQPVYEAALDVAATLDQESPYELNLSRVGPVSAGDTSNDGPYSLGELERVLRAFDPDASKLPSRLWELANRFVPEGATTPNINELNEWRTLLTTDSFDVPVPAVVLPEWMRVGPNGSKEGQGVSSSDDFENVMGQLQADRTTLIAKPPVQLTFSDLLEYRVRLALGVRSRTLPLNPTEQAEEETVRRAMRQLLAPELADGLRLDINRPVGNGRDDNNVGELGYGIVDEPGEDEGTFWRIDDTREGAIAQTAAAQLFQGERAATYHDAVDRDGNGAIEAWERGDPDNSGYVDMLTERIDAQNFRRQLLARHLYVLAMTLTDPPPTTATKVGLNRHARQLAQWAINVVDFRDPDNIMTGFEYDVDPFNGWGQFQNVSDPNSLAIIDGNLTTRGDVYGVNNQPDPNDVGGVVWGAERPELIVTETLAWHDRRTRDSRFEGEVTKAAGEELDPNEPQDVAGGDTSFDQQQRPQGAAFIELYNPWPAETAANADTHLVAGVNDNSSGQAVGTDLGVALAPLDPSNPTNQIPAWRIMVYRNGGVNKNPDSPEEDDRPTNARGDALPDRSVYFQDFDPNIPGDGVAYYNSAASDPSFAWLSTAIRPGRFMVVAGVDTHPDIGQAVNPGEYLVPFGENTSQGTRRGILLRTGVVGTTKAVALTQNWSDPNSVRDIGGYDVDATGDMASVAVIERKESTTTSGYGGTRHIRFSFTEPAGGYPDNVDVESDKAFSNSRFDPTKGKHGEYVPILDVPLDDVISRQFRAAGGGLGPRAPLSPVNDDELRLALPEDDKGPRTIPGFNWIYLQRLANPLLPWNPAPGEVVDATTNVDAHNPNIPVNPYMTIDSMGVNVTVFNGLFNDEKRKRSSGAPYRFSNNTSIQTFASLQRGRANDPTRDLGDLQTLQTHVRLGRRPISLADPSSFANEYAGNLWTSEPIEAATYWANKGGPSGTGIVADSTQYLQGVPDCTLGFLNEPYQDPNQTNAQVRKEQPLNPFPWVTWNNRPYANAGELLQVPKFSTAELPRAFGFIKSTAVNEAYGGGTDGAKIFPDGFVLDGPYPHLMNYFRTKEETTPDPNNPLVLGMYRVLDYVGVPSRFVGTETWLPSTVFGVNDPSEVVVNASDPRYQRQPPFNKVSSYRDPGRVNINTVCGDGSGAVWHGMFHDRTRRAGDGDAHPAIDDDGLVSVRRGYGTLGPQDPPPYTGRPTYLDLSNPRPSVVSNPFRAAGAGNLVPVPNLLRIGTEGTLMRTMGNPPFNDASPVPEGPDPVGVPLMSADTQELYRDAFRNPYFRYQPLSRLTSMATTRSNVYAVWVTIGFFEVEESPSFDDFRGVNDPMGVMTDDEARALYNRVYPDGYQLGQEVGSDTGDFRRLRGFQIVDRTIPVAFEPGENHNVEKAVRIRRRIE